MSKIVETDVLVVGAGPAGAATSVFLGKQGIRTLMISRHGGTAETPRAHITNQRAMEALRDAGLEQQCMQLGSPGAHIEHSFWLRSMAGEELARTWSWGNDPHRSGDYAAASPCRMSDLPQTRLEPILVTEAAHIGVDVRFGWELQSFDQDDDGVTAIIVERLSGQAVTVKARYMVGADGARSRIVEQLGLPLIGQHGLGNVFNVLCDVDLSAYVEHRHGSLYSVIQPGSSYWAPVAVFRMVKPWNQWLVGLIVPQAAGKPEPTEEDFEQRIRESIGNDSLPIKILSTSMWTINDIYAERYAQGRVFCMGDAVHRHPPTNGLGSNTCIQDAFNLAWKLALVVQGKAASSLLDSYEAERQPVGKQIVARANKSFLQNNRVWDLLGGGTRTVMGPKEHAAVFDTPEGRATLRAEVDRMKYEYHAHGVEMARAYESGAVLPDGSPEPVIDGDPELVYRPSTRPGAVVPHVWLTRRTPGTKISTLDVAGKGRFMLFTGPGGEAWREAARETSVATGVEIGVTSIGPFCDYEDPYGWWAQYAGTDENGAVLVRPDHIVAWRRADASGDLAAALSGAMQSILGLAG
ncbi:FAD-dependent monooxygenase [Sphingobium sp. EM0848]|uniref:FAD-dependent oxidoreductase n=1 Tax=Sphingobium sp. EM0848 TaxID=2743473 RepID=UPI002100B4FA|nr:FAD-dependent monooxygenase [Sphingobium sp. EM0848]